MMFLSIAIAVLLGCMMGVVTGITPGLHINLVAVILLSVSPFLLAYTNLMAVAAFILAMSITHTFTDFISATYLGAPSDDTAMAMLPAHRMLLKGMAHEAIKLAVVGSLLCLIITILISPLLIFSVPVVFAFLKDYVGWILVAILMFMVFREKNKEKIPWNLLVVSLSGTLGIIALNMPGLEDPLLPMFSGLFGISVLLLSLNKKTSLPEQRFTETIETDKKETAKAVASGIFSGSLVSIFPGLGPAQAAVLSSQITSKLKEYSYLVLVGGINTVSMIMSLITFLTIEKARNGSIAVVQQMVGSIDAKILLLFFSIALLAGGIATFLTMYTSRIFSILINKVNYNLLTGFIIVFVFSLVFYFSGFIGLSVLAVATLIGLIPNIKELNRSNLMACLLVPIILMSLL